MEFLLDRIPRFIASEAFGKKEHLNQAASGLQKIGKAVLGRRYWSFALDQNNVSIQNTCK